MSKKRIGGISLLAVFLLVSLLAGGCGEDLKAANEKLKKEAADLTAENDNFTSESIRLR
jgi:cell division protein FtsB